MFSRSIILSLVCTISQIPFSLAMDIQQLERQQMSLFHQEVISLVAEAQTAEKKFLVRTKLENKKIEIQDCLDECEDQAAVQFGLQLIYQLNQALAPFQNSQAKLRAKSLLNDINNAPYVPAVPLMMLVEAAGGEQ